MKKIFNLFAVAAVLIIVSGCNDFLNRDPQDKQTNDTFWSSETSLRTYAQNFYSTYFVGYGVDYSIFGGYSFGDDYTDDYIVADGGGYVYFPKSNILDYNSAQSAWSNNYGIIYKANVMIEKIPGMNISDEAKKHWMGVARYFRAMAYSSLLKIYGGCPLITAVIDPSNTKELYKDRSSFLEVAKFVNDDYQFAIDNMRTDDSKLQVNKYVAGAYMSRDLLFHATWLKYHGSEIGPKSTTVGAADIKTLLQGAINGAEIVMNSGKFAIGNTYNALFSVDDLAGNKEIIFYREYTYGVQSNSLMVYGCKENQRGGLTEDAIESFLCSDGLPISQSPLYKGGKYHEVNKGALENRDPRMFDSVVDSLRILGARGITYKDGASCTGYVTKKFLNEEWYRTGSIYVSNTLQSPADAPTIRYAEVLLNFVEARYEISTVGGSPFNQSDLDKSINQIRQRKLTKYGAASAAPAMPSVTLQGSSIAVNGTVINDPKRDADIDPVLWEIRRERRVELMLEGRRGEDLRRWAKYVNLNSEDTDGNPDMTFLGAYINLDETPYKSITGGIQLFDPQNPSATDSRKGYLKYGYKKGLREFTPGDVSSERYYVKAIPNSQIVLYKDKGYTLTQTPGWE
ncbi:MAG: RagB/SusD family nutrient uptake outer membrane protein [Bacteroidales bacterium]|nr:RagB/SusD family nutrient uptake outer membrane protein [Bacteroidales bacterium]